MAEPALDPKPLTGRTDLPLDLIASSLPASPRPKSRNPCGTGPLADPGLLFFVRRRVLPSTVTCQHSGGLLLEQVRPNSLVSRILRAVVRHLEQLRFCVRKPSLRGAIENRRPPTSVWADLHEVGSEQTAHVAGAYP